MTNDFGSRPPVPGSGRPEAGKQRLDLPAFSDGDLVVGASFADGSISAHLMGNADLSCKPRLDLFFTRLNAEALRLGVREVVLDLRKLEFMNSSCLKTVTTWLLTVEQLRPPAQYRVVLSTNGSHWQTRSVQALQYFAPGIVRVQTPAISPR